ncbi:hypothetical protein BGZ47_008769 [Haplosporangium gracile]|nr:hypothetical protein BGZ47_008769 [Haplosporangium gracile]
MSASSANSANKPPHVIICGAGLAGLFLGILLERANIPYTIYERAPEVKPLGAVMCLSTNILAAFDQLGLYDELVSFSKPGGFERFYNDKLEEISTNRSLRADIVGYDFMLFSRPELYNLLLKHTPSHKLHMGSKLISFNQDERGVKVQFEGGSVVEGDILVGADGAHSTVRQHLYKTLNQQGLLPESDTQSMNKGYISLLGTTDPLDPAKYPALAHPDAEVSFVIGDKNTPYTWVVFTIPGNKISWNVIIQLGVSSTADDQAESSDWITQDNQKMLNEIRHFKTPYGTMGDLFDATPTERVSKVYFEDKMFETWNHGRTVVIGDAAHKMLPSTGAGAVNAMQDAVILANCIYDIIPTNFDTVKEALDEFKRQRYDLIKAQYAQTYIAAKIQYGHTLSERILRYFLLNWLPVSMKQKQQVEGAQYRPQAVFIPQAPKRGTCPVLPQKPSKRVQAEDEVKKSSASAL